MMVAWLPGHLGMLSRYLELGALGQYLVVKEAVGVEYSFLLLICPCLQLRVLGSQ